MKNKRFISYIISIFCFLLILPTMVHAEETKEIKIPIEKEYKSIKFTMNFEYYDNYEVLVADPDGKTYTGEYKGGTFVECIVNESKKGEWKVIVKKPDVCDAQVSDADASETASVEQIEDDNSETDTNKEETTDQTSEQNRPISPVKVQVEGSKESLVSVDKDITVATDIAGLKMYFMDDDFIAEWTDTTCGNVNIEIANAKNLQKLDTQSVSDMKYVYTVDKSIEEILVTIVPSVSANVEGAEKTYSFKNDFEPNATVTYEPLEITNHDTIKVSCNLKDAYNIEIYVNGILRESTQTAEAGAKEFDIPIDIGINEISTYIVNDKGYKRSTNHKVEKDVVAPRLELVSDYKGIVTDKESIILEGAVTDYNILRINSTQIKVEGDDTFKYEYKLKEGTNQITICAMDLAGNETPYTISVERVIKEDNSLQTIIALVILALIILFVLFTGKKKNKKATALAAPNSKIEEEKSTEIKAEKEQKSSSPKQTNNNISIEKAMKVYKTVGIVSFLLPLIAAYIILSYAIMVSVVASNSMEPTMTVGNTVVYNRLAYLKNDIQRGDVVVFYSEEYQTYFGKRIIGMPGDTISFKDGYVVINGQYCEESYIDSEVETNCMKDFTVPNDCYFMLGDNREESNDSRFWKEPYIKRNNIIGKYMGEINFSFQYDVFNKILE